MKNIFLHILVLFIVVAPSYSQINRGGQPFTYDTVYQRKVEEQTRKCPEIRNVAVVADLDKAIAQLWNAIEFCCSEYGEEIYNPLVKAINQLNSYYKRQLAARASRRKAKVDVDKEEPIFPC